MFSGSPTSVSATISSETKDSAVASYRKWRYSNGIAEGEQEIEPGAGPNQIWIVNTPVYDNTTSLSYLLFIPLLGSIQLRLYDIQIPMSPMSPKININVVEYLFCLDLLHIGISPVILHYLPVSVILHYLLVSVILHHLLSASECLS